MPSSLSPSDSVCSSNARISADPLRKTTTAINHQPSTINRRRRAAACGLCALLLLLIALVCASHAEPPGEPASSQPLLKQGNARVILVGDSITGQSRNHPAGFARQMDWALQQAYPGCHPDIVALGGSGAGVQAWLNTEKRSRTEPVFLDVKGIDVKANLDQPADVLVIMLGMNDVLAPYVTQDPASWDRWAADYRALITALQTRLKPGCTAVATATLCTEDIASPKNRIIDALNERLVALAHDLNLRVLPTNQTMRQVLARGRRLKPDFHVTADFVHPNEAGHLAVAMGMLRGLGETAAAHALEEQRLAKVLEKAAGEWPTISHEITPLSATPDSDRHSFRVHYWVTTPATDSAPSIQVALSATGWEVTPASLDKAEGEFTATGVPDRWENPLALSATVNGHRLTREVRIPAPWLATVGVLRKPWNDQHPLDPATCRGPMEEGIEAGHNFLTINPGWTPMWMRCFPSVSFTGGDSPDSLDFAAICHARTFEAGYAARWIHSDRDRAVNVQVSTQTFAGSMQMVLWLNGAQIYSGLLTAEPRKRKTIEAHLHTGWNTLVFNLNHMTWQWQCSVHLDPIGNDSLDDLRYSTVPH